jgi:dTDP-4-dehydrorhamnose reductase
LTKLLTYSTILNLDNSISHKEEFVSTCIKLLDNDVPTGIYNLTNDGYVNAEYVLGCFKKHHPPLSFRISTKKFFASIEEFMTKAVAPRSNCILDTDKLRKIGFGMRDARETVDECVKNYNLDFNL